MAKSKMSNEVQCITKLWHTEVFFDLTKYNMHQHVLGMSMSLSAHFRQLFAHWMLIQLSNTRLTTPTHQIIQMIIGVWINHWQLSNHVRYLQYTALRNNKHGVPFGAKWWPQNIIHKICAGMSKKTPSELHKYYVQGKPFRTAQLFTATQLFNISSKHCVCLCYVSSRVSGSAASICEPDLLLWPPGELTPDQKPETDCCALSITCLWPVDPSEM